MFSHINFQTIGVTDQDRALTFYRDKLGLTVQRDVPYEGFGRWIFLELPGARTLLHFGPRADKEKTKMPALVLVTDDVDGTCAILKSRGIDILKGPEDAPWDPSTRWAMIYDTENNLILIQTV